MLVYLNLAGLQGPRYRSEEVKLLDGILALCATPFNVALYELRATFAN
jgi:hypothetical protein